MDQTDSTLLQQFLVWIVAGGGSGAVAFWLIEKVPALAKLKPEPKRYASLALSALLACLAYGGAVGLTYIPTPAGWQGWLEALFAVGFVAVSGSQVIHGRLKLGDRAT